MKVLIIDDEVLVRLSLKRVLKKKSCEVFEAANGRTGEALWLEHQPDLVILDILMPEVSGPELLEKMDGKTKSKVILISAYSGDYDVDGLRGHRIVKFIKKPFENIYETTDEMLQCARME